MLLNMAWETFLSITAFANIAPCPDEDVWSRLQGVTDKSEWMLEYQTRSCKVRVSSLQL